MRISGKTAKFALKVFIGTIVLVGLIVLIISVIGGLMKVRDLSSVEPSYSAFELATRASEQQKAGDIAGAEILYEKALVQDAKLEYRAQLAVVKYRLKKYEEAISAYQELIKAKSNEAFAWNGVGNSYRDWATSEDAGREVRLREAQLAYENAIIADKGYVVAYTNLAILLDDQGQKDEAINIAKKGLEATKRDELTELIKRLEK